jgi:hypothetical protein
MCHVWGPLLICCKFSLPEGFSFPNFLPPTPPKKKKEEEEIISERKKGREDFLYLPPHIFFSKDLRLNPNQIFFSANGDLKFLSHSVQYIFFTCTKVTGLKEAYVNPNPHCFMAITKAAASG